MVHWWHVPAAVFSHRVTRGVGALLCCEPQLKGGWLMKWSRGNKWQIPSLLRRWAQTCADYGLETINLFLAGFRVSINPLVQCPLDWLCNISPRVLREAGGLRGSGWILCDESCVPQFLTFFHKNGKMFYVFIMCFRAFWVFFKKPVKRMGSG